MPAADGLGNPLIGVADVVGVGAIVGVGSTTGVGTPPNPLKPPGEDALPGVAVVLATGARAEFPPHAASSAADRPTAPNDRERKAKRIVCLFSRRSGPYTSASNADVALSALASRDPPGAEA